MLMAFVGACHLWDIHNLEEHGYLDEAQAEALCAGPSWKWNASYVATSFKHIFSS
jgi:hypothetical protein